MNHALTHSRKPLAVLGFGGKTTAVLEISNWSMFDVLFFKFIRKLPDI